MSFVCKIFFCNGSRLHIIIFDNHIRNLIIRNVVWWLRCKHFDGGPSLPTKYNRKLLVSRLYSRGRNWMVANITIRVQTWRLDLSPSFMSKASQLDGGPVLDGAARRVKLYRGERSLTGPGHSWEPLCIPVPAPASTLVGYLYSEHRVWLFIRRWEPRRQNVPEVIKIMFGRSILDKLL